MTGVRDLYMYILEYADTNMDWNEIFRDAKMYKEWHCYITGDDYLNPSSVYGARYVPLVLGGRLLMLPPLKTKVSNVTQSFPLDVWWVSMKEVYRHPSLPNHVTCLPKEGWYLGIFVLVQPFLKRFSISRKYPKIPSAGPTAQADSSYRFPSQAKTVVLGKTLDSIFKYNLVNHYLENFKLLFDCLCL